MIRRCLPYPLLSVLLALIWLLFNQSLAPGTILLGAVLGIALARAYGMLRPLSRKTKLSTGCAPITAGTSSYSTRSPRSRHSPLACRCSRSAISIRRSCRVTRGIPLCRSAV